MGKAGEVVAAALAVCAAALSAVAATSADVPPGTPNPEGIVLKATDFPRPFFPSAVDVSHSTIPAAGELLAGYENDVRFKSPYGASKYVRVDSTALVDADTVYAAYDYARLAHKYSSPAIQKQVATQIAGALKGAKTTAIKPRSLGFIDSSMEIGFVVTAPKSAPTNVSVELLRMDRIVVLNIAIGRGSTIAIADAKVLVGQVAAHASARLGPSLYALPTVTGTPQVGQTLTGTPGTWGGMPATYGYEWQDCNATATTCKRIPNATSSTYVLQATDVNQSVRVAAIATTRYGKRYAYSAVTAPVAP